MTLAWWALAGIVLFANWVEALAGFGSTLFALILGVHFFPLDQLIPALLPINLLLSGYIVSRHSRWIDWRVLGRRILPWAGAGTLIGIAIFSLVPQRELKLLFGAVVVALSAFELYRSTRSRAPAERALGFWGGSLWLLGGGLMQGIFASGGPMVVYFSSRALKDKNVFRSTLSMLWLLLNLAVLASFLFTGRFSLTSVQLSAWMIVPLLLGIILGEWAHSRVPERLFRQVVHSLLLLAGLSLLLF